MNRLERSVGCKPDASLAKVSFTRVYKLPFLGWNKITTGVKFGVSARKRLYETA